MIITCPSCSARYKLDPAQFGPEGRRVRCTKCAHVWTELPPDDLPRPVVPDVSAAVGAAMEGMSGADTGTDAGADAPPRLDFQPPGDAVARAAAQRRIAAAQGAPRGRRVAWLMLVLVVVSLLVAGFLAREAVVHAWPPAERLYAVIGLTPAKPGAGLKIKVIEHRRDIDGKTAVLIVKGEVTNIANAVRDVPRLKASLRTDHGTELTTWTFATAQARLLPGETAPFVTRIENPSTQATALNIDFIANGG